MRWFGVFEAFLQRIPWVPLLLIAVAAAGGVYLGAFAARGFGGAGGAEARRQWARRLADASFDGLLVHRAGTILQMNRALVRLLGYREVELLGTHFANLAQPAQVSELRTELETPQPQIARFTLLHADKTERIVEMASHTLQLEGRPATVTAIRDLTAMQSLETRLGFLIHNDPLTGLANYPMFAERLHEAVTRNDTAGGTTAVLTLQLEQLKAVNDQLGRRGGDSLLRQIASRLKQLADASDTVARLSGHQFAIVQPHTGAPNRTASLLSQIETAMEEPLIVEGRAIRVSMTIGIAIYPEHASGAEGLINASGFALSKAIEHGGSHSFSHAEAAAAGFGAAASGSLGGRMLNLDEQRLAHDLRLAIGRAEITLEYQPVFTAQHLSLCGYEALARWRHPRDGEIPPSRFIPLADDAGLGSVLGSFILETACAEAVRTDAASMAIKISPVQFRDRQLAIRIRNALQKQALPAGRLEVQLTEAMLLENPAGSAQALLALRDIGVGLTLNDFGTGFSSLRNLSDFPFTRIKIDKNFIHALEADANAQAIVLAILSMARSLKMQVTAEGIESEAQLRFLQDRQCHFVQGYHLAPPQPRAEAAPRRSGPESASLPAATPVPGGPLPGGPFQGGPFQGGPPPVELGNLLMTPR